MTSITDTPVASDAEVQPQSRAQKIIRATKWTGFGFGCLIFFTLVQFPTQKIKSYIQGSITAALAPHGLSLLAQESDLSLLFGPRFSMSKVTLTLPPPHGTLKFEELIVRPSLLALLTGKTSASATLKFEKKGRVDADFSLRKESYALELETRDIDLAQFQPVLAFLTPSTGGGAGMGQTTLPKISGKLELDADVTGNLRNLKELKGDFRLKIAPLTTDEAKVMSFDIPKLSMQLAEIQMEFRDSKALIKKFTIGKALPADSLLVDISGDVKLGTFYGQSEPNLKVKFNWSDSIPKTYTGFLDAMLMTFKQPDGTYQMGISGTLDAARIAPASP